MGSHPPPAPPGKRLSCIQRLLDGGAAAASPVPGRANLGLVEQRYKYLPLRDPVTQPRSRKGSAALLQGSEPRCLRGSALPPGVPPCPGSRPGHWGAEPRGGWHSGGWIMRASTGDISATSTESGKCQLQGSPPPAPRPPPALLYKHNVPKPTLYSTTNAPHETPMPPFTFTPSCRALGTLHHLAHVQTLSPRSPPQPLCTIKPAVG